MTFVVPPSPAPRRSKLIDRARAFILTRLSGSSESIPALDNRADAREHLPGNGPFMHFVVSSKKSERRTNTRGKRREQRERARA